MGAAKVWVGFIVEVPQPFRKPRLKKIQEHGGVSGDPLIAALFPPHGQCGFGGIREGILLIGEALDLFDRDAFVGGDP